MFVRPENPSTLYFLATFLKKSLLLALEIKGSHEGNSRIEIEAEVSLSILPHFFLTKTDVLIDIDTNQQMKQIHGAPLVTFTYFFT